MVTEDVGFNIRARDNASMVLDRVSMKMGVLNKRGLAMGMGFGIMSAGLGIVQQGLHGLKDHLSESVQSYRDFEKSMAEVSTMLDETGMTLLPSMTDAIEGMSLAFGKSAVDLSRGMYEILSAGVDSADAVNVLRNSAKLAAATLSSVETATDAVTTTLNSYSMSAIQAEHVSDILAKTVQLGKLRLDDLAGSLGFVLPIASQAGVSFEEVAAAIGTLTKQGLDSHKATRGLRQVINSIISPSEDAINAMSGLGIAYDDLSLEAVGLRGTLTMINDAADGQIGVISSLIPNVQALNAALGLSGLQADTFSDSLDYIRSDFNALDQMYNKVAGSSSFLKAKQEALGAAFQRATGEDIEPYDRAMGDMHRQAMKLAFDWKTYFPLAAPFSMGGVLESEQALMDKANKAASMALDTDKLDSYAAGFERINSTFDEQAGLVDRLQNRMELYDSDLRRLSEQKNILESTHDLKEALHYIPLALKDSAYASGIFDEQTKALVNSIRIQRGEIENLTDANNIYSSKIQGNQLQALKIQLSAMDRRGRMTRDEKKQLENLEREDLQYRIKSLENTNKIDKIKQNSLTLEEARLDKIRTAYTDQVRVITDSHGQELQVMESAISYKELLIDEYTGYIENASQNALNAWQVFYDEWLAMDAEMRSKLVSGYGLELPDKPTYATGTKGISDLSSSSDAVSGSIPLWKRNEPGVNDLLGYQHGTPYVPETGIYQLHRGEAVIPRSENRSAVNRTVKVEMPPITVNATLQDLTDVESFGNKMGQAIAAGLVSGCTSNFEIA